MEVNHDDEFGTTGFIRVAFGLGGSPGNSRTQNRLLEPTRRNDHIVRFNQQPEYATNPITGQLWNVVHVDNSNAPVGDGTAENPYKRLVDGQNASAANDIIYVHHGDGSANFQANGITLKNEQQLLGAGTRSLYRDQGSRRVRAQADRQAEPDHHQPGRQRRHAGQHNVVSGLTIEYAKTGISGTGVEGAILAQQYQSRGDQWHSADQLHRPRRHLRQSYHPGGRRRRASC